MSRRITVGDLPEKPGPHTLLLCRKCGNEYSATRGDYFILPKSRVMRCCGRNLVLVSGYRAYREARP